MRSCTSTFFPLDCKLSAPCAFQLSAFPTTAVATLGDDLKDHLASIFTAVLGTNNLNSLIFGLVAGDLDLGAGLLAEIVDGSATGSDDEPIIY
jgi:hypothetical protein